MDKILITSDTIEFLGFDLLKEKITICFYSGGIVIIPDWRTEKLPCHYESSLDNSRKIRDIILVRELNSRGIFTEDEFIEANNHYIEMNPHPRMSH